MSKRLQLRITGLVQGVCYRAYASEEASRLGLTGWVRNLEDGSVEALAEGPEHALLAFAAWCEEGPPHAQVVSVERRWAAASGEYHTFSVERWR